MEFPRAWGGHLIKSCVECDIYAGKVEVSLKVEKISDKKSVDIIRFEVTPESPE